VLEKALERGLWLSGLDEELRAGRLTLGTQIEDQGRNLSGGQRQKVALARALLRPVPILLLDEPGLGLDPDAERLLATRLAQDLGDTTLIMVTHSGELINAAQRLLVLDGGRLVADGPREQLLRRPLIRGILQPSPRIRGCAPSLIDAMALQPHQEPVTGQWHGNERAGGRQCMRAINMLWVFECVYSGTRS
jgi:ABC-type sulfate/molybdate transport systems ATPase subunit